jgi:hypothetical protein
MARQYKQEWMVNTFLLKKKIMSLIEMTDKDKKLYRAQFKYNGAAGALICTGCRKIIKTGAKFTPAEWEAFRGEVELGPQYCEQCQEKRRWAGVIDDSKPGSTKL